MKNIVLIFIFQFLINCSVSNDPMAPNSQNIRYLITEGKALWEQRSDTSAMSRAKYFIGLAYKENNLDSELAPLIGEMNYTRAYFLEADPEKRDSIFLVGSEICKKISQSIKNKQNPVINVSNMIKKLSRKLL